MKNLILTSTLFMAIFLLSSCNKKACLSENAYNGLYNALTCDYESRINSININTSDEELKNIELFTAYQELIAKVTHKEDELSHYKQKIQNTENLIREIELKIENLDTQKDTQGLLTKIRYQVISMKENIKTQQPRFTTSDIQLAKRKIKDKKIKKIVLAKKFLKKNSHSEAELNQAYSKNYQKNQKVQKALQEKLNTSIRAILMSEKANHLNEKSKKELMRALKETKRYTSKIK